jgi:hypothetical protein
MNVAMIGLAFNVVLNDTSYSELPAIVTPKASEINNLTDEIFPSLSLAGAELTRAEDV